MSRQISEPDWKIFRHVHTITLDRFCQRVLSEIAAVAGDSNKTSHERYLEVFRLIRMRDKELARAFDKLSRSMALHHLALIRMYGLLTEEEFARFSRDTREAVESLLEIMKS